MLSSSVDKYTYKNLQVPESLVIYTYINLQVPESLVILFFFSIFFKFYFLKCVLKNKTSFRSYIYFVSCEFHLFNRLRKTVSKELNL